MTPRVADGVIRIGAAVQHGVEWKAGGRQIRQVGFVCMAHEDTPRVCRAGGVEETSDGWNGHADTSHIGAALPEHAGRGAEIVLHVDNQQRRVLRPNDFVKLIVDLSSCEFAHDQSPAATRSRISALLVSRRTVKSGGTMMVVSYSGITT